MSDPIRVDITAVPDAVEIEAVEFPEAFVVTLSPARGNPKDHCVNVSPFTVAIDDHIIRSQREVDPERSEARLSNAVIEVICPWRST